jgi:hypothetical protein
VRCTRVLCRPATGINQAVNFTAYNNWSKKQVLAWKTKREEEKMGGSTTGKAVELDHWQSLLLGGLSGGMGPVANNPLGAFWKEPLWVECCSILLMRIM